MPVSLLEKRFRRFRFRFRFLEKRFRRFQFPVPVRFLSHPARERENLFRRELLETYFTGKFRSPQNTPVTPAPRIQGKNMIKKPGQNMTPKALIKTRQTRQFGGHIFVHIFALYVGVGVAKRLPIPIPTPNPPNRKCFNHVHVQKRGFTKFPVFLKRVSLLNPQVRTNFVAFPIERTRKEPRNSVQLFGSSREGTELDRT